MREQTDLGSRRGQHRLQGLHEPSANIVGGIQPGVLGEYDHPQPRCILGRGCPPKKSTRHCMRELILNGSKSVQRDVPAGRLVCGSHGQCSRPQQQHVVQPQHENPVLSFQWHGVRQHSDPLDNCGYNVIPAGKTKSCSS